MTRLWRRLRSRWHVLRRSDQLDAEMRVPLSDFYDQVRSSGATRRGIGSVTPSVLMLRWTGE